MKLEHLDKFSKKTPEKPNFTVNTSRGSRTVPCGGTHSQRGRQTDMTKLTVACPNFASAPVTGGGGGGGGKLKKKLNTAYTSMVFLSARGHASYKNIISCSHLHYCIIDKRKYCHITQLCI